MENGRNFGYDFNIQKGERRVEQNESIKKDEGIVKQGDCP